MIRIPTKITSKDFYKLLLILFWGKNFVCAYLRAVFLRLPVISQFADYIIPGIALICGLFAVPYLAKRISGKDIVFLLVIVAAYCTNLMVYRPTYEYLMELAPEFWISVLPVFILGLRIDPEEDVPLLYYMSLLNIWLHFLYVLVFGEDLSQEQSLYSGAMGRAYNLLPQLLMVTAVTFRKANLFNIVTLATGSVYLFSCGTRGAILCLFLFILISLLLRTSGRQRLILYLLTAFAMVLVLMFYNGILLWMRSVARALGMSERIFNALQSESFFVSDSRTRLARQALEAIAARPVFGYGIAGDQAIMGNYSHNLLLELLVSFGLVQGILLFLYLMQLVLRSYFKAAGKWAKELVVLLFCGTIVKLFISSSYLLEPLFFMMLGVCTTQIRMGKRRSAGGRSDSIRYERKYHENM